MARNENATVESVCFIVVATTQIQLTLFHVCALQIRTILIHLVGPCLPNDYC